WGTPGDLVVELSTLKPIADPIGPLTIVLDHERGSLRVEQQTRPLDVLAAASNSGIKALELADALHYGGKDRARKERARRELDRLVDEGLADRETGTNIVPTRWFARAPRVHPPADVHGVDERGARIGSGAGHAQVHG